MASFSERINADGSLSFKVYWSLPKFMVPVGAKKATGSLTVYSRTDCMLAMEIAERRKHAVTGDQVADELQALRSAELAESSVMTLRKWFGIWIENLVAGPNLSQRQIDTYRGQFINVILPARPRVNEPDESRVVPLGDRPLSGMEAIVFDTFFNDLARSGKKPATVKTYKAALRACLNVAILSPAMSGITTNPVTGIKINSQPVDDEDREPEKFFEREQYEVMLQSMDPASALFVKFLCETGMRFSEATALTVRDFNWNTNVVAIRSAHKRTYSGRSIAKAGVPKGKSARWAEVPPTVMSLVRVHVDRLGLGENDLIFRAPQGGRIHHSNFVNRRWAPLMLKLSRCPIHPPADNKGRSSCTCLGDISWTRFRPHALRHTWATWAWLAGVRIEDISRQLGHPDTAFTERTYVHLMKARPMGVGSVMDAYMGRG